MAKIIGIDPGWSGGIAMVGDEVKAEKFTGRTEKDICEVVAAYLKGANVVFIEKVHAMPGQGVSSMFKFGHITGMLRGCIFNSKVPMHEVTPQKWQRTLNCLTKGDKNVTKSRAQMLYPYLKVTHATADALLIATYGAATAITDPLGAEKMFI